jgi:hypothetical protein
MAEGLAERYGERIAGVLSCYGRIVTTGKVSGICHAQGTTAFLRANGIRIFDYPQFAATLRDTVRENAATVAEAAGAELGLIYVRVPTWAPFRLQVYCNGHSWLARKLTAEGIGFTAGDNALLHIDDWQRAQELADSFSPGMGVISGPGH